MKEYKHTQNMHSNSGCTNMPWGYIIGMLPVLLEIMVFGSLSHNLNILKLLQLTAGIYLQHSLQQNISTVVIALI
jgi:hypothetical protein